MAASPCLRVHIWIGTVFTAFSIKNGILAGRLHNAQTAAALEEMPTGNARAIDCTFEPIVRMTTTYIEGGDLDFDQLIAPIRKGYFIKSIRHGTRTPPLPRWVRWLLARQCMW